MQKAEALLCTPVPTDEELDAMSADALVSAALSVQQEFRDVTDRGSELSTLSGKMLARLHDTHGMSWPQLGRLFGMNASSVWRRAEPYLQRD